MIVHDNWIFVHNPKCAGSRVRGQLFNIPGYVAFGNPWPEHLGPKPKTTTHLTQAELVDLFPEWAEKFEDRPSFGLVRNPYQRFESAYRYMVNQFGWQGTPQDLADALPKQPIEDYPRARVAIEQHRMFYLDGKRRVTHVAKLEDVMHTDWQVCGLHLDMNEYSNMTPRDIPYEETPALRQSVRDIYAEDFEVFGYDA